MSQLHPIVLQKPPSAEQLPAVVTVDRDVVLTAGAGTGKTRTLVARILQLLATGVPTARHRRRHLTTKGRTF
ncbi:MAG: UvrD-helicase domain-containing protein [Caldilineaceae bacterium]|nr:UvrD-helicase domain-containing protein [Caldilineaceae bacterium]